MLPLYSAKALKSIDFSIYYHCISQNFCCCFSDFCTNISHLQHSNGKCFKSAVTVGRGSAAELCSARGRSPLGGRPRKSPSAISRSRTSPLPPTKKYKQKAEIKFSAFNLCFIFTFISLAISDTFIHIFYSLAINFYLLFIVPIVLSITKINIAE